MDNSNTFNSVAIIGMNGRFPMSRDLEQWWQNLRDGKELISFFSDEELRSAGVDEAVLKNPNFVKAGAVMDDVASFDATFFGFNPREAEIIDPQQRIFLECAYHALENAGYTSQTYPGRIGVYAGQTLNIYWFNNIIPNKQLLQSVGGFQAFTSNDKDFLPTRVSYKLNLRGPSVNVQTACSTSLVAVHLACQSLLNGESDIALAGGVSLQHLQPSGYFYQEGGIMSPDGHCRAFDARAQGTLAGSGVAIVVLKRLSQALADGDNIHAVIKGSAINNDGSLKVGYTAPSIDGQSEVIAEAQAVARVDARTVTYVEAHGTATNLGDPIEVAALTQAFRASTDATKFCAIGSVKTNMGHLDAAAGVTGLIKAVLQLKHRELVPSLHFREANPRIDFANSPFYVNARLRGWERVEGVPLRAGVSSFGIGGTNAHVVVEEAPEVEGGGESRACQLLVLSAKTAAALERATENLVDYLRQDRGVELADVAYTCQVGRTAYGHRRAVVCHSTEDAVAALASGDPQRVWSGDGEAGEREVAFMFPGQGAQYVNMGRELYEREPEFRRRLDECADTLTQELGEDLRHVLYPPAGREQEASRRLTETRLTQPALFAVEYALARLLISWGVRPSAMIGHSLGEYVAACLSGVMSLGDALRLVAARGRLMQQLPAGAMASVPLAEGEVRGLLGAGLSIAAVNGPASSVVSGPVEAVEGFIARAREERGVEARRLQTSHAFHSGMMDGMLEEFRGEVRRIKLNKPQVPYISNVSGLWVTPEQATDVEYWVGQVRECVRFGEGVRELMKDGGRVLLEVGPGTTLSSLARVQAGPRRVVATMRHVRDESRSDLEVLLSGLGRLWASGVEVEWGGYYVGERRRRVELPGYPFERQRFWVEPQSGTDGGQQLQRPMAKRADIADWFYLPSWERSTPTLRPKLSNAPGQQSIWLVFADEYGLGAAIAGRLKAEGQDAISVVMGDRFKEVGDGKYHLNPKRQEDYKRLLKELREAGRAPGRIVHLWNVSEGIEVARGVESTEESKVLSFYSLLYLAQSIESEMEGQTLQLAVVTSNMQEVVGGEGLCPEKALVLGPCRVVPQEYPNITCRSIDVVLPCARAPQETVSDQILAELVAGSPDTVVAYRGNYRWVQSFRPVRLDSEDGCVRQLRDRGVYLITGGLGGIGLELAEYLASAAQAKLVLVGRSAFPPREEWEEWLATHDQQDAISRRIRKVQAIERLGAEVLPLSADVADREQMREVIRLAGERFGKINGVIHAAGVAGGGLIQRQTPEMVEPVLAPKVRGTQVLDRLLGDEELDFFVLCSSQRSIMGAPGRVEYCAANAFLDAFALARNSQQHGSMASIVWDGWGEVGMGADQSPVVANQLFEDVTMRNEEGVEVFRRVLGSSLPLIIVSTQDLKARIEQHKTLTASGLLEERSKSRLSTPAHPRPNLKNAYAAPRDEIEQILADIWQQLLGIERVGIHDNFFELGGDSVISIQIIARANQAGLQLTPKQVFQHQTIAELAEVAGTTAAIHSEQGLVTGPVPLTPIQHWFFEQRLPAPHHWNQAVLLEARRPLDPALLEGAINGLLAHHDALRLRFTEAGGAWRQVNAGSEGAVPFARVDLSGVGGEAEQRAVLERVAGEAQASLNLSEGPLVRVVLFEMGVGRASRLLIIIHHLAVDLISWRILLDDLQTAYRQLSDGERIQLPAKTTSFQHWARRFTEDARSGAFNEELDYWLAEPRRQVVRLPVDFDGGEETDTEASARIVSVALGAEETHALLHEVPKAYNTQINDALLTALVQSFAQWTGNGALLVDLEGLGRESILEDVDLSRTVGWFTSVYPVLLQLGDSSDPGESLKSIKEQLRRVPNRGIGYGALRYLSGEAEVAERLGSLPQAEVIFLYQGQSELVADDGAMFGPAGESTGSIHAPQGQLTHRLSINGMVEGGRLRFDWAYSERVYREETVAGLAQDFMGALRLLIDHCQSKDAGGFTPSDFIAAKMSKKDFDSLFAEINRSVERRDK